MDSSLLRDAGWADGSLVVLDGGLATELERAGADLKDPLWSAKLLVTDPGRIRQVHLDYFRAGARVATTASYQASYEGFAARGLDRRQANELLRLSVHLAQEARELHAVKAPAAGPRLLVAASVGCYGASLHDGSEYRGDYGLTQRQLIDWHRPRLEALLEAAPDLLACETIPCLLEAEALARLLEEYSATPAWLSFSCRDGERLCHGERFAQAVALANAAPSVVAVGVNCTAPRHIEPLLQGVAGETRKTLIAYPNSGETWHASSQEWSGAPEGMDWPDVARRWLRAGARWLGGCCRTTPATIGRLSALMSHDDALR